MRNLLALFIALTVLAVQPAHGATQFKAMLSHEQEVSDPPIPNEGSSGIGTFVLNDAQTQLTYDVTLSGLDLDGLQTPGNANDNVTRVHFHRAPFGTNGTIVFGIIDGSAGLRNDINPNDLVVTPATGRIIGKWDLTEGANNNGTTTLATELVNLLGNGLYFNVHTSDHAGGEIRGQVTLVPEPTSLALMLLALLAALPRRLGRQRP